MNRRLWIPLILIAALGLILTGYTGAEAKGPKRLIFANWLPPMNPVSKCLDEWAREFESKTGGRYKVDVQHGGVLAGIPQSYDVVLSGVADISEVICMDVEKPFPLTDIPSMPFFNTPADISTKAWLDNVFNKGYLDKEFSDVKLLFQFIPMGEDFLTPKPVKSMADLKGLKVCIGGGPIKGKLMKAVGAVGVFGGPPDAYMMLQKGIAEAVFISGLGLKEFHWDEFIHYIIEPLRLGVAVHSVVMNKDTYNRLPDDVKAILEEMNADGRYALKAAKGFQDIYDATLKTFVAEGGKYIDWNKEEKAELDKLAASIWEEWIKTQESRGIEAKKVIDAYYNGLKALGVEDPALGYRP